MYPSTSTEEAWTSWPSLQYGNQWVDAKVLFLDLLLLKMITSSVDFT